MAILLRLVSVAYQLYEDKLGEQCAHVVLHPLISRYSFIPLCFYLTIEPICLRTRSTKDMGIIMDVTMIDPASVIIIPEPPGLSPELFLSEARAAFYMSG